MSTTTVYVPQAPAGVLILVTQGAPRVLKVTLASPVQHRNIALSEVAMSTPNTTIDSSATVTDQSGVLLSSETVTLAVSYQDGTSAAPSVVNEGSGVYTATYNTKGPGVLTELWSITDGTGVIASESRVLVIAY